MAIANLTVRGRLDASGITRGVQDLARQMRDAQRQIRDSFGRESLLPNMEAQGRRAAEELINSLQKTFRSRADATRRALEAGLINETEAARQGRQAADALNRGILAGMRELSRRGLLTPEIQQQLVAQMQNAGKAMGRRTAQGMAEEITASSLVSRALEQQVQAATTALSTRLGSLGTSLRSIGTTLTVGVTAPLTALAGVSVKAAADMERLERSLVAITGSSAEAARQLRRLEDVARLPGIGFQEAVQGAANLQLLGFSAEQAERTLRQFGNAIALTGGGQAELGRVITQLTQMASAGRILTQDLRPIIQTAPAVGQALQRAFGTIDPQAIEQQLAAAGQGFDEFLSRVLDALETMPRAADGIGNAMESLRDGIFQARAAIGEQMVPAVRGLVSVAGELADRIRELDPATVRLGVSIGMVVAVLGPLAAILGGVVLGVTALVGAIGGLATLIGGGVLVGLGALAAMWVDNKLEAAAAAEAVREFNRSLQEMDPDALRAQRERVLAQAQEIADTIGRLERANFRGQNDIAIQKYREQGQALQQQLVIIDQLLNRTEEVNRTNDEIVVDVEKIRREQEQAVRAVAQLAKFGDLRADGIAKALELERQLRRELEQGNVSLERRAEIHQLIAQLPRVGLETVPQPVRLPVRILGVNITNVEEFRREYERQVQERLEREEVKSRLNLNLIPTVSIDQHLQDKHGARLQQDIEAFNQVMEATREVTQGIRDMADALGELSPELSQALSGIDQMVQGMVRFQQSGTQAGLLGALGRISGVLSVAAGAFTIVQGLIGGDSEREKRREELIEKNNEALKRLRDTLERTNPIPTFVRALDLMQRIGLADPEGLYNKEVLKFLQDVARQLDIDFLAPGGWWALQEALEATIRALRAFEESLSGFAERRQLRQTILGEEATGAENVQALFGDLATLFPDLFAKFFEGVDLSDFEAVRRAVLDFFDTISSLTGLDLAQLLGDATIDEILEWIYNVAIAINQAIDEQEAEAAREAARQFSIALTDMEIAAREAALAGNDLEAQIIRRQMQAEQEIQQYRELYEAGQITEEQFERIVDIIGRETVEAVNRLRDAVARMQADFEAGLDIDILNLLGDTNEARRLQFELQRDRAREEAERLFANDPAKLAEVMEKIDRRFELQLLSLDDMAQQVGRAMRDAASEEVVRSVRGITELQANRLIDVSMSQLTVSQSQLAVLQSIEANTRRGGDGASLPIHPTFAGARNAELHIHVNVSGPGLTPGNARLIGNQIGQGLAEDPAFVRALNQSMGWEISAEVRHSGDARVS